LEESTLPALIMNFNEILNILDDIPDYKTFNTVDELKDSSYRLAAMYPGTVEILYIGHSRQGEVIEAIKIGNGQKKALLFALPHPNEPVGAMMLEYLSLRLAQDNSLRNSLGYSWYLIKCIDPDSTRLNEGWFKGPFTIENYARHHYRPPSYHQIEWTFPIDYKTLHFHKPLPETQALMNLIDQVKPDFIFSLHNSGFGGVYYYITEKAQSLYKPFYDVVRSQDLPLHLGEPEMPYIPIYSDAIFKMTGAIEEYDFLKKQNGYDPAEIMKGGTDSFDYARKYVKPFGLVCEVPYFYNPRINDTSPSDILRRDAILTAIKQDKEDCHFLQEQYKIIENEVLTTYSQQLSAEKNWAKTNQKTNQIATIAEKFDNLSIRRFYQLFPIGMFIRMIDYQINAVDESMTLATTRRDVSNVFNKKINELEKKLDYTVIPIRKLVSIQLGSALLAADYAARK
jgi:hypothetical protein